MTKVSSVFAALTLAVTLSLTASGKEQSIQGVWQVVEVAVAGAGSIPIPEPRPNLTILTARHYSRVEVHAPGPRTMPGDITKATADELRAAWGPFVGEAGTYEIQGDVMTMRPIVAKNPAAMAPGAFTTWTFKLENNTLVVTAKATQDGPVANPVTVKAVRIER